MCISTVVRANPVVRDSLRDQFGGTRQDRICFNPDCTAEPRTASLSDKISKFIIAPFLLLSVLRSGRTDLSSLPSKRKKGPGIAKKVRVSAETSEPAGGRSNVAV